MADLPQIDGLSLPDAAIAWAAAGWRVHPCSPVHKRPLLAARKDDAGKRVPRSGWTEQASADPAVVAGWWKRNKNALIGLCMGDDRLFVVDFDPRVDAETGEIFELDGLKAETEAMIGGALPVSVTSVTQSGGVHLWLRWPDDGGPPVTNRGNLPPHVDVRGAGGYVIAPPSVMAAGGRYRWAKGRSPADVAVAEAPAALVALLRAGKAAAAPTAGEGQGPRPSAKVGTGFAPGRAGGDSPGTGDASSAQRRYALAALDAIEARVRGAGSGARNAELNKGAFAAAQLVAAGVLSATVARAVIEEAARANPGRDDAGQLAATIDSGWQAGLAVPFDLSGIGTRAATAARRPTPGPARSGSRTLPARKDGGPNVAAGVGEADFVALPEGDAAALAGRGRGWALALAGRAMTADAERRERAAWRIGTATAAGVVPPLAAVAAIWALAAQGSEGGAGWDSASGVAVLRAAQDGMDHPRVPAGWIDDLHCSALPMTDLGNAERFVRRHGDDFRYTTAKGWLGWDGRRWAVLDQEQDTTPAAVLAAVMATVRSIQDEARTVDQSGVKGSAPGGRDFIWRQTKAATTWFCDALGAWGRTSEASGKIGCIPGLAKRWLTVPIEAFDTEPFAVNCENGTVRVVKDADGNVSARLDPHRREDLIAKLAPVRFDAEAWARGEYPPRPLFDALIRWAQPEKPVRRYLRQWLGYSASAHVGAQILQFWYGLGANGKSTVIDVAAATMGDYADTIGIETFLDQGIKKRGDAATPDLAKLGGVRLLRASEPERGAKLNEALVKAATGGEPMSVRALHKGFFSLQPQFKLTMAGNSKPDIPGTDEGIWRRIKLVNWPKHLAKEDRDPDLVDKIKGKFLGVAGELDGVFAWLIAGLCDWRANGFVEPDSVTAATEEYREDSDPLSRFLKMCVERDADARVQSSVLYGVFCAWARAAGEYEWKHKGFTQAMKAKGFKTKASNGMQFEGLKLVRSADDFVDDEGKVRVLNAAGDSAKAANSAPPPVEDDDPGPDWGDVGNSDWNR